MEPSQVPGQAPEPTEQDWENACIRREIADRQEAEYVQCLKWSLGAFAPGWPPTHRHFLIKKKEEKRVPYKDERPRGAAPFYPGKNGGGDARHFTVEDGKVVEHESYEAGFGTMLLEPHP